MPTNEIFFSYAWGDEKEQGESREKIVNELYESLKQDGYNVVRDKVDLGYRGFITDFMKRIGEGNSIVVVISNKYVKSPYCMFELYEIARNSNFDKHKFSEKTLPLIIERVDFSQPAILQEHLTYWKNIYNEHKRLLKKNTDELSIEWNQRFDKIKMIHQNFSKLAEWMIDMNTLNPQMLSAGNFSEIKKAIENNAVKTEKIAETKTNAGAKDKNSATINNEGAKIGQQNINSNVDNRGSNFNVS